MRSLLLLLSLHLVPLPTLCGIKSLASHFDLRVTDEPDTILESGDYLFLDSSVTRNLISEEEEDYLDWDQILGEDHDDDDYIDEIDEIEDELEFDPVAERADPATKRARLLGLFHGKTRIQRLNTVNTDFAFDLYRRLSNSSNQYDNILLAPVGISTTLAMISLGAGSHTHQQLFHTLGFGAFVNASTKYDVITVHNLFRRLTHRLFRHKFGYTLHSVNGLFVRQDTNLLGNFTENMKTYYFAEAQLSNFSDPGLVTKLNQRILKLTKGMVRDSIQAIDPRTLLMILNCLYFKGTWENKFPVEKTYRRVFRVSEKVTVKVPMMHTKGNFLTAVDPELECDILQLPYVGNSSMLVVLPHKLSGMKSLEKRLVAEVVVKWQSKMTNRSREVVFPKFSLAKQYDLMPYLKGMGLTLPFQAGADFSRISTQEDLIINLLKHQGSITVNEEGTTAASLTKASFMPLSIQNDFVVNRPFLFLIYEHRTECLLFMGRVMNPESS
uniref:Heparin cofactor 2-like protein n=1 Tax=Callorhinchus milii TaxID=7868 RepID=K4FT04_CALMI|nr:heparin cofactor 2-like protein [Callorhinchus milii]